MRFPIKICVYFNHFLYLCIRIITIYLVTFVDRITDFLRELFSLISNVTCESGGVSCLVPLIV